MFTVLDSGKGHIDPILKRWEDEEMLDSIRHLFITREDNDRSITEDQDGEQDTIDDEDNASDADSSTPCPQITNPIGPPSQKSSQTKFDAQYGDPRSSHLDFYSEEKTEIADQLVLSRTEFEGIDTDARNLIEGYQPGHHMHIQLANLPGE